MDSLNSKARILIVDDEPGNITLLATVLKRKYKLIVATNGRNALELASAGNCPDLILLDIMMPEMDGYEVCSQLKTDKKCRDIPVIFITAMNEALDETRGFELGAVDYITKPFNLDIVEARVRTHLELKRHRDHLEELAEHRARQIAHMERLSTMGLLSAGICHEISNYLNSISAAPDMLEMQLDHFFSSLAENFNQGTRTSIKCDDFMAKNRRYLSYIRKGVEKMSSVVESMRTFSRSDDGRMGLVSIENCIGEALSLCASELKNHVTVCKSIDRELPEFYGNKQQMEQVLINLFKNAIDAMKGFENEMLEVSAAFVSQGIRITVEDTGPGIPPERIETIWEPFYTTKDAEKGTGLGLSICKGIIGDHNGDIRVENRNSGGARFIIDLPPADADDFSLVSGITAVSRKKCRSKSSNRIDNLTACLAL